MTTRSRIWTRAVLVFTLGAASIALAGCSVLLGGSSANIPTPTPSTGTDVTTIKVGDCINDGGVQGQVSTVPTVDCSAPHDSEVYASIAMTDGAFPGDAVVQQQATDGCKAKFNTFAGINFDQSALNFAFYYPTSNSWALGDRAILCLIFDPKAKVSGTLAGAAR